MPRRPVCAGGPDSASKGEGHRRTYLCLHCEHVDLSDCTQRTVANE